jgi:type II secretory pathway component PulK
MQILNQEVPLQVEVLKMNKKSFLKNQKGSIAIMMVISAVVIITPVVVNFTFDTTVNQLKVYNIEDRAKAKLTAESGIKFAIARLRLYKEAYNFLQNNSAAKEVVKPQTLDMIWNFPFIYPIPTSGKMNAIQREAIKDFHEKTILDGTMQLTINNISNKINLNLLRISLLVEAQTQQNTETEESSNNEDDEQFNAESQLIKALTNAIELESEKNENFSSQYFGLEVDPLVNELKYYISDPRSIEDAAGADSAFATAEVSPKRAPLVSTSELYSLPSWPDEITNLILNEFTVHGAIMIDLNKITDKLLTLLIPDITPEDIAEFFKYKNDPDDPKHFNSLADFKNYIVNIGNIMNESDFKERFDKFLKQGLQFGPTPTLFKVVCSSTVGRSTFNLTAYITLPAQPKPRPKKPTSEEDEEEDENENNTENNTENNNESNTEDENSNNSNEGEDSENTEETEEKTLLLEPRVVEIIVG